MIKIDDLYWQMKRGIVKDPHKIAMIYTFIAARCAWRLVWFIPIYLARIIFTIAVFFAYFSISLAKDAWEATK
jgi:hypothetical protein